MSQTLLGIGTYACDATGFVGRLGWAAIGAIYNTNQVVDTGGMFTELFALAALTSAPQLINIGTYMAGTNPLDLKNPAIKLGDTAPVAFAKVNANFTTIFSVVGSGLPQLVSLGGGPGMIVGQNSPIIGTGDPARVAGEKINNNFTYLYTIL